MRRITLSRYLIEEQREKGKINADLRLLIEVVARACKSIAIAIGKGCLGVGHSLSIGMRLTDLLGSSGSVEPVARRVDDIGDPVGLGRTRRNRSGRDQRVNNGQRRVERLITENDRLIVDHGLRERRWRRRCGKDVGHHPTARKHDGRKK